MCLRREKRPMNVGDDYQWSNARRRVQAEMMVSSAQQRREKRAGTFFYTDDGLVIPCSSRLRSFDLRPS
jgi:hypothetical protein